MPEKWASVYRKVEAHIDFLKGSDAFERDVNLLIEKNRLTDVAIATLAMEHDLSVLTLDIPANEIS